MARHILKSKLMGLFVFICICTLTTFAPISANGKKKNAIPRKPSSQSGLKCHAGTIRLQHWKSYESQKGSYCYSPEFNVLYSKGCEDESCLRSLDYSSVKEEQLFGQYGTPGARLCIQVGGRAEIVEFEVNKKWYKLDRCLIKNKDYVDLGTLYNYYMNNVSSDRNL